MLKSTVLGLMAAIVLSGCGERVEVPPAHVGKVLTKSGFSTDLIPPSKFRLPACVAYCDKLIVVEVSDVAIEEPMQLFMPKDQLNLQFDLRMTASMSGKSSDINSVFDRVTAGEDGTVRLIKVYEIYAKPIVRSAARTVMANYSINQIAENRSAVEAELFAGVQKALESTPILMRHVGLADIQFPEIIVKAKEAAKEREVAIERAEAQKLVQLVEAEAELELAVKDRLVRLERARTILEENRTVSESVTPQYLEYRRLEVMEAMAAAGNTVFFPAEMMTSIGLQTRLFQETEQ